MKRKVNDILSQVIHPETGKNLIDSNMIESMAMSDDRIAVTILFPRPRDPFAVPIKKQVQQLLQNTFPEMRDKINVIIKEAPAKKPSVEKKEQLDGISKVKKIIAIASGKGGVGKSTVTSNLAVTFASMGYKTGVLDADIYGPSQPKMFGVEGYVPEMVVRDGKELLIPAEAYRVKIMSIGFFIKPDDALVWRGPMATSALKQMIHQTDWGVLDFLLIDLPPGTGDVHLTILHEMKIDGAVIVSTPQQVAIADVLRGVSMFRSPKIEIPVLGIIENMAWFTPAELPENKYYIFGKGGAAKLAKSDSLNFLGEIPIIQSVMEGAESGKPDVTTTAAVSKFYEQTARNIVNNLT